MILDKFAQLFACKLILRHANRPGKNFCTAPYFIMHAYLINYALYSLSLNTINNSLGNWIYTSLIVTYCTNKRGFFSRRFFPRCFSLSLSIFPSFSSPVLWRALLTNYPSFNQLSLFFLFFTSPAWIKYRLKLTRKLYSYISDDESNDELHFVFASSKNILLTMPQTLLFNVMQWDSCWCWLNV